MSFLLESAEDADGYRDDPAAACAPLGRFLLWMVERGLAPDHEDDVELLRFAPGAYVVRECDSSLGADDFHPRTHGFLRSLYLAYRNAGGIDAALEALLDRELNEEARTPKERPPRPTFVPGQTVRHAALGEGTITMTEQPRKGVERYRVRFGDKKKKNVPADELVLVCDVMRIETKTGEIIERSLTNPRKPPIRRRSDPDDGERTG